MFNKNIADIIQDTRVCIDMNRVTSGLSGISDAETLSLDEIIRSKVLDAIDHVNMHAPYYMLEANGYLTGNPLFNNIVGGNAVAPYSGYIVLPDGSGDDTNDKFLRLIMFKMSDWTRPVYSVISINDPEYAKQNSPFVGIGGTKERPVCAISYRDTSNDSTPKIKRVLEFFSCASSSAKIEFAPYIKKSYIPANEIVQVSEQCYEAVIYTIAGMTLTTLRESQQATNMFELANSLLKI